MFLFEDTSVKTLELFKNFEKLEDFKFWLKKGKEELTSRWFLHSFSVNSHSVMARELGYFSVIG